MKEHGLLFSTPMAQALDAGRKFRTMRAITRSNSLLFNVSTGETRIPKVEEWTAARWDQARTECDHIARLWEDFALSLCPRIQVGDVIWSKETHAPNGQSYDGPTWRYFATTEDVVRVRWTASILQPRAAARFLLPVASVRAQRPADLTCSEISREGIDVPEGWLQITTAWRELWTEINGAESWERNDLCWTYEWEEIRRGP